MAEKLINGFSTQGFKPALVEDSMNEIISYAPINNGVCKPDLEKVVKLRSGLTFFVLYYYLPIRRVILLIFL